MFLIFSTSFLIAAVVTAIKALNIRSVKKSPYGKNTAFLASGYDKIKSLSEFEEWSGNFIFDQIDSWKKTRNSIATENEIKARFVKKANNYLKMAILTIALLSILKLIDLIRLYFGDTV